MLLVFEKLLELVIKIQIEVFLENNKIITEHQSGFRRQYSYKTTIQTIMNRK